MAAKAHLRNDRPVVIGVSTNDGLGANFQNIGSLMNRKNMFFIPFGQDDFIKKPNSLVAIGDNCRLPWIWQKKGDRSSRFFCRPIML